MKKITDLRYEILKFLYKQDHAIPIEDLEKSLSSYSLKKVDDVVFDLIAKRLVHMKYRELDKDLIPCGPKYISITDEGRYEYDAHLDSHFKDRFARTTAITALALSGIGLIISTIALLK